MVPRNSRIIGGSPLPRKPLVELDTDPRSVVDIWAELKLPTSWRLECLFARTLSESRKNKAGSWGDGDRRHKALLQTTMRREIRVAPRVMRVCP